MSDITAPRHIGLILDGNRRWAKDKGLPTLEGHRRGYNALINIAEEAFDRGVEYLSAYIFSTENWSRAEEEVSYLMDLALKMLTRDAKKLHKKNIRILWAGQTDRLSQDMVDRANAAVDLTKDNTAGNLVLCFNYGGQTEIVDAVKSAIRAGVDEESLTQETFEQFLYAPSVPPVDLVVRTSGEHRLSNFQLWRSAYAEFIFIEKHWPDFTSVDLDGVIAEFSARDRRVGK